MDTLVIKENKVVGFSSAGFHRPAAQPRTAALPLSEAVLRFFACRGFCSSVLGRKMRNKGNVFQRQCFRKTHQTETAVSRAVDHVGGYLLPMRYVRT